jgi:outer membrane protein assembly factor BamC
MTQLKSAIALATLLALTVGCSRTVLPTKKVDYKSATQAAPLEVPPDLPAPATSDRYTLPEAPGRTIATYSEYSQDKPNRVQVQQGVLPAYEGAHIARAGTQRWLVVSANPEAVWPVLREFWQEQGFIIAADNPQLGIMETDWAENRAKIPQSLVRDVLGKVLDQAYSTPELDRFKTRVERGTQPNITEIYVTHRGAYEMYVADANLRQTGKVQWQPRQPDPNLEAEMLSRLMVRFGTPESVAAAEVKQTKLEPRASLAKGANGQPVLMLKDDFDRAWRRVGLSLDRLGFSVQDRNREEGMYFVRYLSPPAPSKEDSSFMSKLAFWRSDEDKAAKAGDYRVKVTSIGTGTEVKVLGADGKPEVSEAANQMLAVLQEDLR